MGIYSIITLACNQRRKEIALRKVNGATLKDILLIFIREYGLLVVISSVLAFSTGTFIMHQWLLQYVKRTTIDIGVYVLLFLAAVALVVLCVGYRVWHTANENPAKVLKSE